MGIEIRDKEKNFECLKKRIRLLSTEFDIPIKYQLDSKEYFAVWFDKEKHKK